MVQGLQDGGAKGILGRAEGESGAVAKQEKGV